jgi:predicted DCC family thiol-disulfide oxidoreductase YuxK
MPDVLRVSKPPPKPLMVFDGDCNFCTLWIRRWQQMTGDIVDYIPSQDPKVTEQFREISREQFDASVQFIQRDGMVFTGAEAVFRALACNPHRQWPLHIFERSKAFASFAGRVYRFVAEHRQVFSVLTRLLWGKHVEKPAHFLTRSIFLRVLGVIYLVAFISYWTQFSGLIGHNGILPNDQFMAAVKQQCDTLGIGAERVHVLPTLCWLNPSDGFLKFQCAAGTVLSVLLVLGFAPAPCLVLLWVIYLSLVTVGREFYGFQWDNLLLETGFLAIFFSPLNLVTQSSPLRYLFPAKIRQKLTGETPVPRIALWLLRLLLFKLMFSSGCVKLLSGDPNWRNLTALMFHYYTQPLPTWIGWYANQLPVAFQKFSCAAMFAIELGAPWLIFTPRRTRFIGAASLFLLQILILSTGNYTFFNFLTLALCVLLFDDFAWQTILPAKLCSRFNGPTTQPLINIKWLRVVTVPLAVVIIAIYYFQIAPMFGARNSFLYPVAVVDEWLGPFRTFSSYGLFAVMTTDRREIIIEGSNDGVTWQSYEFKYKPGDVNRRPQFVAPYQPRLDWQMWFAALGDYRQNPWLANLCARLLQGSPDVLALLKTNPFPDKPPRYIRAQFYDYHFTDFAERRATGAWWKRELIGEYSPVVSLHQ